MGPDAGVICPLQHGQNTGIWTVVCDPNLWESAAIVN